MKKLLPAFCFVFATVVALILTSCETESVKNNDVTITPVSIGLHNGEYADFTASGGYDYSWSLQNPSWGVLSNLTGPTTRYTDRYDPGSNLNASAVQVLTVTSTIQGEGGGSSSNAVATNAATGTAIAQIEHLPTNAGTNTATATVTITPSSSSALTKGSSEPFTASGGTGSYTWSLSDPTVGTLAVQGSGGNLATFTDEYLPGVSNTVYQTLYVTDSDGIIGTASLTLTQYTN